MAVYFSMRIMGGHLDYTAVVTRYPQFKTGIDDILIAEGKQDLIIE